MESQALAKAAPLASTPPRASRKRRLPRSSVETQTGVAALEKVPEKMRKLNNGKKVAAPATAEKKKLEEDTQARLKQDQVQDPPGRAHQILKHGQAISNAFSSKVSIRSWNVNGLNACFNNGGFDAFFKDSQPDIVGLNETRVDLKKLAKNPWKDQVPKEYEQHWFCAETKGYSGAALFTKVKPLAVTYGLGAAKHDSDGRLITAEFDQFFFVITYVPNSGRDLAKLEYRTKEWDVDLRAHLSKLVERKPVVWSGDLNVSHRQIDHYSTCTEETMAGFTAEEKAGFDAILETGFVDAFRKLHPEEDKKTFWGRRKFQEARGASGGRRLDYFVVSKELMENVTSCLTHPELRGSDHCPISLEFSLPS